MKRKPLHRRGKRRKCWRFRRLASSRRNRSGSRPFLSRDRHCGRRHLRAAAADPGFLDGVLDHMLGDEPLLIAFADSAGHRPGRYRRARTRSGAGP